MQRAINGLEALHISVTRGILGQRLRNARGPPPPRKYATLSLPRQPPRPLPTTSRPVRQCSPGPVLSSDLPQHPSPFLLFSLPPAPLHSLSLSPSPPPLHTRMYPISRSFRLAFSLLRFVYPSICPSLPFVCNISPLLLVAPLLKGVKVLFFEPLPLLSFFPSLFLRIGGGGRE